MDEVLGSPIGQRTANGGRNVLCAELNEENVTSEVIHAIYAAVVVVVLMLTNVQNIGGWDSMGRARD